MWTPASEVNRVLGKFGWRRCSAARRCSYSNTRLRWHCLRRIHGHLIRTHQHNDPNAMSQVINSCGLSPLLELENSALPVWNSIIRGLSQSDYPACALKLFDKMRERGVGADNLTFIFIFKACARVPDVFYGRRMHARASKLGFGSYLYVCNALIHMYGCCRHLRSSREVFDEMPQRDLVSWNSLICAYSQCAKHREVLALFDLMKAENEKVQADSITMVKAVLACTILGESDRLDSFVEYIDDNHIEMDVYLGNTLINAYGSLGSLSMARSFFDRMPKKNLVSWNTMIVAAAKFGDLRKAKELFDETPERDIVSWTSLISAYSQGNRPKEAIILFIEMMAAKISPDQMTLATVLSASARVGRLDLGKSIHGIIEKRSTKPDIYTSNALIDMYCKCGSVPDAMKAFHTMKEKDSVSWTSIISGLAVNGDSGHALGLFSEMLREGFAPIPGTFVGILLACVHAGLVDKGLHFFHAMQKDYGLKPAMKHYGCVVDLLCRAGYLDKAHDFIIKMPVSPDPVIWAILLGACKVHGNLVFAEIAMEKLTESDGGNGLNYVLSSNSYAVAEKWEDATRMREFVHQGGSLKPLGWSYLQCME